MSSVEQQNDIDGMDPSSLCVKISGPMFSKILHERYKDSSNCGGLLYGQVVSRTKNEITDSRHTTTSESLLYVQDYLPLTNKSFFSHVKMWPRNKAWSPGTGSPQVSCVGFYRVRNSSNRLSLLEKSMHKRLSESLQSGQRMRPNDFIVTLLITRESNIDATCLSWKMNAYVRQNLHFLPIKIEILNLQGSVSGLYNTEANPASVSLSGKTDAVLRSFQSSLTHEDDEAKLKVVEATRGATQNLLSELDRAFEKLGCSEKALEDALKERAALLAKLKALKGRKEAIQGQGDGASHDDSSCSATSKKSSNSRVATVGREEENPYDMSRNEYEYQVEKRRSLEDIRKRSPVVMLEKLDASRRTGHPDSSMPVADIRPAPSDNSSQDSFGDSVLSVKEDLKQDVADDGSSSALCDEPPGESDC